MNNSLIVGIDPAKQKMTVAFLAPDDAKAGSGADLEMTRAGLETLGRWIDARQAADLRVVVGVEATAALDDNLLAWLAAQRGRWPLTLLRLDPAQVARFSGARPVRGKTDTADARRIAAFTAAHARQLEDFERDPLAQAMKRLVNERGTLVDERVALTCRLRDRLVISFPEATEVFANPTTPLARAVLRTVPTASHAQRKRIATLERIKPQAKGSHALGKARAARLLELAQDSIASATTSGDGEAIIFMLDQFELLERRIAAIEEDLRAFQASATSPETQSESAGEGAAVVAAAIPHQIARLAAMRGIGTVGASAIVLGTEGLARFTSPEALAAQLGTCPDRVQTGSSRDGGRLTHRGDRRTRSTLYMLTLAMTQFDPALAFHRFRMRQGGHRPKQAICACMNRLARIMWAVATGPTPYDPRRAIRIAQQQHPELWKTFVTKTRLNAKLWRGHEDFLQIEP